MRGDITLNNLLVITGAGASYNVIDETQIDVDPIFKAPLTKNLFNSRIGGHITKCLKKNPLAHQVGYNFHTYTNSKNEELNLEQYLLDLKNSNQSSLKKQYWAVPLYLHDIFQGVSHSYLPTSCGLPSNYKSLIDIIGGSKYHQIIWLNLNYDLLADQAIKMSIKNRLNHVRLEHYMQFETEDGKKIKYTKPHGSIDWFLQINIPDISWDRIRGGIIPDNFEEKLSKKIITKYEITNSDKYYPAISAPIGEYDFIYKQHIESIIPDLQSTNDVLLIGFSALDKDILNLIKDNVKEIKKLKIVNGKQKYGQEAYYRLTEHLINVSAYKEKVVFNGGFSRFISEELKKWLS